MDVMNRPKLDISTIMINLLAIAFLSYIVWILCKIGVYLRVVAVYSLMMPKFISIWRAFRRTTKITDLEQWVFIIIAVVLWVIQSFMTGKLRGLFS